MAAIVGHNAAAALAFDDAASGAKILSGLRAKPSIARAVAVPARRGGVCHLHAQRRRRAVYAAGQCSPTRRCSAPSN